MLAINDALGTRKAKAAARLAFLFGQKGLKVRNLSIGDMYQLQGEAFIHVWPLPLRFE